MSAYTAAPVIFKPVGGIRHRQIGETRWEIGLKGSGHFFTVPSGTIFDVSIPRLLWWAFDPHDPRYLKAAALHDEMLKAGYDRLTAAGAFNEALKADGVGSARRFAMVSAVAFWRWS